MDKQIEIKRGGMVDLLNQEMNELQEGLKQKQVEEMARIIAFDLCQNRSVHAKWGEEAQCYSDNNFSECIQIKNVVDKLYNAGYRKIPENGVVLTGTETEERLVDLLVDFDEMTFFPLTLCPNPEEYTKEWKQKLIYAIGQLRKEMAEKFAELAKAKLNEWLKDNEDNDGKIDFGIAEIELIGVKSLEGEVISESLIDEICKEITDKEVQNGN